MRRVICPDCRTELQVAGTGEATIRCPRCQKAMRLRAVPAAAAAGRQGTTPGQTAPRQMASGQKGPRPARTPTSAAPRNVAPRTAAPTPRPVPSAPADPFAGLPTFAAPRRPVPNVYREPPPAPTPTPKSAPVHPAPGQYRSAPPPPQQARRSGRSGSGSVWVKIVLGIAATGLAGLLLCAVLVGLAISGVLAGGHRGWEQATFQGCDIKLPAGGDQRRKTHTMIGGLAHEITGRRKESGSQYTLVVTQVPAANGVDLDTVVDRMRVSFSGLRKVQRNGMTGIAGTVVHGSVPEGSEMELFLKGNRLIVATYAPYSKIKDTVGGKMKPRRNERELDKPDEFFASLRIH